MPNISQLEKSILHHKRLYYQGNPEISDDEYDQLEEAIQKALSPANPSLASCRNSQRYKAKKENMKQKCYPWRKLTA